MLTCNTCFYFHVIPFGDFFNTMNCNKEAIPEVNFVTHLWFRRTSSLHIFLLDSRENVWDINLLLHYKAARLHLVGDYAQVTYLRQVLFSLITRLAQPIRDPDFCLLSCIFCQLLGKVRDVGCSVFDCECGRLRHVP